MNQEHFTKPNESKLSLAYRLIDISIITASLILSCLFLNVPWEQQYTSAAIAASSLMMIFSIRRDTYRSWRLFGLLQELKELITLWGLVVAGMLLLTYALKITEDYSRLATGIWVILTPVLISFSRIIVRNTASKLREKGWNTSKVAIVGANNQGVSFAQTLKRAGWMGLKVVGFYDDRGDSRIVEDTNYQIIGNLENLVTHARNGDIDLIYITMPLKAEDRTKELISKLSDTTVSLYYVPDFVSLDVLHGRWETLGNSPIVSIFETPHHGIDGTAKRIADITVASIILALIAVPMILIALGIKLTSPGPVIFRQKRYGINGQSIEVWKFRSMTVCENDEVVNQAKKCDVRVTKLGAFLRRTSLDELPQFINVLQGHMSIIGPRPHAVSHNEAYRGMIHRYMLRHKVKPGITGWAQVNGWRGETDNIYKMEKRIEYDLEYIQNWSIWLDIKIFFMTLFKGFVNKNAY